jgi:hypothetical protein
MDTQADKVTLQQILQFMTTEHLALQTASTATIAEANGRSALFLSSVSSAVVALAFIGQVSGMGEPFFLFGLVLFPSLFFLGIFTFVRVVQIMIADVVNAVGINRIRHYYVELAPEVRRYFTHAIHDDMAGVSPLGVAPSKWQLFLTNSGMVGVINSILAGVFAGLLSRFTFSLPMYAALGLGITVFGVSIVAHRRFQSKKFEELESTLEVLFPSDSK